MPSIPSTIIPYQPQNLTAEQANGNILLTWQGSLGSTSYEVLRSTDGVNFSNLATTTVSTQYIDSLPGIGIMYWYAVTGQNGAGSSSPSVAVQMVAAPPSEMSLFELRLRSQQAADRVDSDFVTTPEWNSFLRLAMYELYDLLIGSYEDMFSSSFVFINTNGLSQNYPIPDGVTNYIGGVYPNPLAGQPGSTGFPLVPGIGGAPAPGSPLPGVPAPAQYKIVGMDLGVNTSNNAWVTLLKFNFIDRNKYVYPNSTSTIYGVYNMRYREMGDFINMIPTPAGNQQIRMWYAPKLKGLLADNDLTTLGFSGWIRYVIVRAAKYALDKEEGSDTSKQDAELVFLKTRIEQMSQNRDIGEPDKISETRQDSVYGGNGFGGGGSQGGW